MAKQKYRTIVHVDMDAFFASIEQMDTPEYRGKPVVVGADPMKGSGRGVVSAASYEARRFGIHSAMPISRAYSLCPEAVFLKPRMYRYIEMSGEIMDILYNFSPIIEPISIDEAFIDATGTERLFGPPMELGIKIKNEVNIRTGLTASVGIASNKSIAKIASDLEKPDGLTICEFGREKDFLAPLPVERLWGAGRKTVEILNSMGIKTMGELTGFPIETLEFVLGKWGAHLWYLAMGIDDRPVSSEGGRKSISEETTFRKDTDDDGSIKNAILKIADRLSRRMREEALRGRTITLKIRLEGFSTYTRSVTINSPKNDMFTLRDIACQIYSNFDRNNKKVRLIGINVSNLTEEQEDQQLNLFSDYESKGISELKIEKLETVLDKLKNNFGDNVLRASLLKKDSSQSHK